MCRSGVGYSIWPGAYACSPELPDSVTCALIQFFGCFHCFFIQCHDDVDVQLCSCGGATGTYACMNGIMPQGRKDAIKDRPWSVLKRNYPSFLCCLLIFCYPLT